MGQLMYIYSWSLAPPDPRPGTQSLLFDYSKCIQCANTIKLYLLFGYITTFLLYPFTGYLVCARACVRACACACARACAWACAPACAPVRACAHNACVGRREMSYWKKLLRPRESVLLLNFLLIIFRGYSPIACKLLIINCLTLLDKYVKNSLTS